MKKASLSLVLTLAMLIALYSTRQKDDVVSSKVMIISISAAIDKYYAENISYPANIEQIVPKYISAIPILPLKVKDVYYVSKGKYYEISFSSADTIYLYRSTDHKWHEYRS